MYSSLQKSYSRFRLTKKEFHLLWNKVDPQKPPLQGRTGLKLHKTSRLSTYFIQRQSLWGIREPGWYISARQKRSSETKTGAKGAGFVSAVEFSSPLDSPDMMVFKVVFLFFFIHCFEM